MLWGRPLPEQVGQPLVLKTLFEQALAANPENANLHAKLGYLYVDGKDYTNAAATFANALRFGHPPHEISVLLARCYNYLKRHHDALAVLASYGEAAFERGRALMELGDTAVAEREFRRVLAEHYDDAPACRMLCRILRRGDRIAEIVELCETLAARGASNAQMLFNWGWALALAGDSERARRLMFEPERIICEMLPVPGGHLALKTFNDGLAEEILSSPNKLSDFPVEDEANRGSQRIDNLFLGQRPDLIDDLLKAIENAVAAYSPIAQQGFDPWPRCRPAAARLRAWGLIQRAGQYEEGHIHPGGWLSGVYYVRVPEFVSRQPPGPGCIEFQPPSAIAKAMPDFAPTKRYVPREGMLLLAPSHYQHRTIPSGIEEDRISIAFDVVREIRDDASRRI